MTRFDVVGKPARPTPDYAKSWQRSEDYAKPEFASGLGEVSKLFFADLDGHGQDDLACLFSGGEDLIVKYFGTPIHEVSE